MARYGASGEPVRYRLADAQAGACLFLPELRKPQPGLLFIHDRQGVDAQALGIAERYAHVGYATLAVDLYLGEPPGSAREAAALAARLKREQVAANLHAALAWLKAHPKVRAASVGVVGVGTGGTHALALAASAALQATIVLDGDPRLVREYATRARSPLQCLFAGKGQAEGNQDLQPLQDIWTAAGVQVEVHIYPDAARGFFDERGTAFHFESAEDAWSRSNKFCYRYLGEPGDE